MVKPKIWHLIGDKRAGGSNLLVERLSQSALKEDFDFLTLRLEAISAARRREKPDLIVFHYPCAWRYLWRLLVLKLQVPVYICDHHYCQGFEKEQVKSPWRFRLLLRLAYGLAQGVIAVSSAQKEWMVNARLVNSAKVTVILPASPLDSFLALAPKAPGETLILGAYGRFAPQKGFSQFLQRVPQILTPQVRLKLGGYGQDEAEIQALAAALPQVELVGAVGDVSEFLSQCDAVVIPSRWEPFGLVCLEAKASGRAVLVAEVDGLTEQVRDCGLALPLDDVPAWKQAIESLTPQTLKQWGENGRRSAEGAWQTCLRDWGHFFREKTQGGGGEKLADG
ncbi:MAG: glycosyltransferase family 4 protein [Cyanobacteriota bacterium]|jgi:glycosyltransferase involved in cell wall biosynthesis